MSWKAWRMFLDEIWNQREKSGYYYGNEEEEDQKIEAQRFLQFLAQNRMKSNQTSM
ncbi:MAG: hypothetical protein U5K71_14800 [Gracilimonas sp.]|nr:hypothetical protein [Gracilimonas sp.]